MTYEESEQTVPFEKELQRFGEVLRHAIRDTADLITWRQIDVHSLAFARKIFVRRLLDGAVHNCLNRVETCIVTSDDAASIGIGRVTRAG